MKIDWKKAFTALVALATALEQIVHILPDSWHMPVTVGLVALLAIGRSIWPETEFPRSGGPGGPKGATRVERTFRSALNGKAVGSRTTGILPVLLLLTLAGCGHLTSGQRYDVATMTVCDSFTSALEALHTRLDLCAENDDGECVEGTRDAIRYTALATTAGCNIPAVVPRPGYE